MKGLMSSTSISWFRSLPKERKYDLAPWKREDEPLNLFAATARDAREEANIGGGDEDVSDGNEDFSEDVGLAMWL